MPAGVHVARETAIRIWFGDELPTGPLDRLAVPVGYGGSSRKRVRLHQDLTPLDACTRLDGLPIVGPAWTVLGIARVHGLRAGVIAADTAYRRDLCMPVDFHKLLPFLRGRRGVVVCREVVQLARPGTDSPRETDLRLVLVRGGLPDVDVDIRITDEWTGIVLSRTEMGYRHLLISIEYDGFVPHTERSQFGHDRRRWRWYRDRGWHQLLFTDDDLRRPGQVIREVAQAIADAPRRIVSLDPRRSPEVRAARIGLGLDVPRDVP